MKLLHLFLAILLLFSCKETNVPVESSNDNEQVTPQIKQNKYPEALEKIFEAHGSLKKWKNYKTLSYSIAGEIQTIDLYSRKDKIKNPAFEMGFDGKNVWLLDEKEVYKGDPIFYHNLMFYFYAMPFVLADEGIIYSKTEDLLFENKSYPGIRIGYKDGVGTSSKDEYYLHYNPETYQMAWLGYTVTYKSGEKSDKINWIRYDEWMKIDDLILPSSITWYAYEGSKIKEPKNVVNFDNVILSKQSETVNFYAMPKDAVVVTKK